MLDLCLGPSPQLTFGWLMFLRSSILRAAVVLLLMNSVSTVEAACGDYLYRHGQPVNRATGMTKHAEHIDAGESEHQTPVPCNGPGCSSQHDFPLAPHSQVERRLLTESAVLKSSESRRQTPESVLAIPASDDAESPTSERLFRPPRTC